MKFGRELLEHIQRCERDAPDPCSREDYVDYKQLKKRIKEGISQRDFQALYAAELARLLAGLERESPLARDPRYAVINRTALDKISKKFDKQLHGQVRALNWMTSNAELAQVIGAQSIDNAFLPPDLRRSKDLPSNGFVVFAAGAFSGIASRTLTAPLDRVKVLLQVGQADAGQVALRVSGNDICGTVRAILSDGGLVALWQGNMANLLKVVPESAVKFWTYAKVKALMSDGGVALPFTERFAAGCVAGAVSQAVVYPLDVTKTRLAACPAGTYSGIWDCVDRTLRVEGLRGLYKGLGAAVLAVVPASGIDLAVYNSLRVHYADYIRRQGRPSSELPIALSLCFGATSACCAAVVGYPLTVVRTRLMTQGMPGRRVDEYDGIFDCFRKIVRSSGFPGLYGGLKPAMLKTVPAVSLGWGAFEGAKRLMAFSEEVCCKALK